MAYLVLSPDGIPIDCDPPATLAEARQAAEEFARTLEWQGYYFDCSHRRIPLEDVPDLCRYVEVDDDYYADEEDE